MSRAAYSSSIRHPWRHPNGLAFRLFRPRTMRPWSTLTTHARLAVGPYRLRPHGGSAQEAALRRRVAGVLSARPGPHPGTWTVARRLHRRVAAGVGHRHGPWLLRLQALRLAGHVPREPAPPAA